MQIHKAQAIRRYLSEIHLEKGSAYEGELSSGSKTTKMSNEKMKPQTEQDHQFENLLEDLLDEIAGH